jgi:SPP1 gp7 family putative phage head morphogenesis protein
MRDWHEGNAEALQVIGRAHARTTEAILADIERIAGSYYQRYKQYGLTAEEAAANLANPISKAEYDRLKGIILAMPDGQQKGELLIRASSAAYSFRISQKAALMDSVTARIAILTAETEHTVGVRLLEAAIEARNAAGLDLSKRLGTAARIGTTDAMLEEILRQPWSGANYSQRIWRSGEALTKNLHEILDVGLLAGYGNERMAKELQRRIMGVYQGELDDAIAAGDAKLEADIRKLMTQSYNNAIRLIRTETTYITNQATLEGYRQAGIVMYQDLATLDDRTSEICQTLDGERFYVDQAQAGLNLPPMHPNCRSATVAVVDAMAIENSSAQREAGADLQNSEGVLTHMQRIAKDVNGEYQYLPLETRYPDYYDLTNDRGWNERESTEAARLKLSQRVSEAIASQVKEIVSPLLTDYGYKVERRSVIIKSKAARTLPSIGLPNSIADWVSGVGELLQRRFYDNAGRARLDIDLNDHGNSKAHPSGAHAHDWKWNAGRLLRQDARLFSFMELRILIDIITEGKNYHVVVPRRK